MAPAKETDGNKTDIQTLLIMLSCCGELGLDSKALAGAFGIARGDNAMRKVKQVLTRYDYKYESGKVTRIDGDGSGDITAVETPKKRNKATETPASKKRKLKEAGSEDDGGEELGETRDWGEVKTEIEEEAV